jgi:hypothetical protein
MTYSGLFNCAQRERKMEPKGSPTATMSVRKNAESRK